MRYFITLSVLFAGVSLQSCRSVDRQQSDLSSLRNVGKDVTAQDLVQCKGSHVSNFDRYINAELKDGELVQDPNGEIDGRQVIFSHERNHGVLRDVMSSVPPKVFEFLFSRGARILLVANVDDFCGAESQGNAYDGCVMRENEAQLPTLILNTKRTNAAFYEDGMSDEEAYSVVRKELGNNFVYGVGRLLAEILDTHAVAGSSVELRERGNGDELYLRQSTELAFFGLEDIAVANYKLQKDGNDAGYGIGSLASGINNIDSILSTDESLFAVGEKGAAVSVRDRNERWRLWSPQARSASGSTLRNEFFAHAFDSYYCTTSAKGEEGESTRDHMQREFPQTYTRMASGSGIEAHLEASFESLALTEMPEGVSVEEAGSEDQELLPSGDQGVLALNGRRLGFEVLNFMAQAVTFPVRVIRGDRRIVNGDRRILNGNRRIVNGGRPIVNGVRRAANGVRRVAHFNRTQGFGSRVKGFANGGRFFHGCGIGKRRC